LSFIANTAQPDPIIIKKKAANTDTREVPARVPNRKAFPRNMRKEPIIKKSRAIIRRAKKRCIYTV
jgi:hypothetical protein